MIAIPTDYLKELGIKAGEVPITNGGRFISRSNLWLLLAEGMKTTEQVIIYPPRKMDFVAHQAQYPLLSGRHACPPRNP